MFYVYAIMSEVNGRIYVGQTESLDNRLRYHNAGYVESTCNDRPWKCIAKEQFETRNKARWKEYSLKKSKGSREKWLQCNAI